MRLIHPSTWFSACTDFPSNFSVATLITPFAHLLSVLHMRCHAQIHFLFFITLIIASISEVINIGKGTIYYSLLISPCNIAFSLHSSSLSPFLLFSSLLLIIRMSSIFVCSLIHVINFLYLHITHSIFFAIPMYTPFSFLPYFRTGIFIFPLPFLSVHFLGCFIILFCDAKKVISTVLVVSFSVTFS